MAVTAWKMELRQTRFGWPVASCSLVFYETRHSSVVINIVGQKEAPVKWPFPKKYCSEARLLYL